MRASAILLTIALVLGPTLAARAQDPDAALEARVAERIAAALPGATVGDERTPARVYGPDDRYAIAVDAEDGHVVLRGEVPRPRIAMEAVEAARRVGGVAMVENDLRLARSRALYDRYGYFPYGYPRPAAEAGDAR